MAALKSANSANCGASAAHSGPRIVPTFEPSTVHRDATSSATRPLSISTAASAFAAKQAVAMWTLKFALVSVTSASAGLLGTAWRAQASAAFSLASWRLATPLAVVITFARTTSMEIETFRALCRTSVTIGVSSTSCDSICRL